jgi:hypothetical protein
MTLRLEHRRLCRALLMSVSQRGSLGPANLSIKGLAVLEHCSLVVLDSTWRAPFSARESGLYQRDARPRRTQATLPSGDARYDGK